MAVAFGTIGTGLTGANSTTAAVPVPASVATGNTIVVPFYVEVAQAVTAPAGFFEAPGSPVICGSSLYLHVYWKFQTSATGAGETTGTYAFTVAAGLVWRTAVAIRFTGGVSMPGANRSPFEAIRTAVNTSASTSMASVASATTGADRLWLYIGANLAGSAVTTISTFTEPYNADALDVQYKVVAAQNATGALSPTISSSVSAVWLGALLSPGGVAGEGNNPSHMVAVQRAGFY